MSELSDTEESEWTKANLQKLLAALKESIPAAERMRVYTKGLKAVDWNQVAFPPFSPEECQEKWREILQKMRKIRTLTEIIVEAEDVISNPAQNIKVHPELPKRPSPPCALFYEENWAKFRVQHPEMTRQKLLRFISKKYKGLSEEEKSLYEEKFQLASVEYKRKMLEFRRHYDNKPSSDERRKKRRKRRVSADPPDSAEDADGLPPKPPSNGYHLFCKEQRASMAGVSKNSYVIVWAQRWRDLTESERDDYSSRCRDLKRQYVTELNEFLMTLDEEEQERILKKYGIKRPKQHKVIKRKVKRKKLPGEPKMPSRASNIVFYKGQMELLKKEYPNSRERFIKCNQMWQHLSYKEKERYKEKVSENIRKYSMELQKWFKTLTSAEQESYRTCNPSKCQYLSAKQMKVYEREEVCTYRPSDSEDEDIEEDSSSDEEEDYGEDEEEEEEDDDEEEEGDDMFELF